MEWSGDEIKQAIAAKEISAITLDTSVFDGNGNRFEHGLLARLNQFNATDDITFLISDVVAGEVRRHVAQEAADSRTKVTSALKEVGKAWQTTIANRDAALNALFGEESPQELAERRFETFLEETAAEILESKDRVDVSRMLQDYFEGVAPFGKVANKKNEFPDAIALQALENWAIEHDTVILAVSKDGDWKKYAKSSEHLQVVDDLALALSYFHQNANVACSRLVARLKSGELEVDELIQVAVETAVNYSVVVPEISSGYFFEAEIDEVVVRAVRLNHEAFRGDPFRVVDKPKEDLLVVEAQVEADIEVSADITFSVTDSVDRDEVVIGSTYAETTVTRNFTVLLTFEGDLGADAELMDAEVSSKGRNVNIPVNFGEVSPDWDEGEKEEEEEEEEE